MVARADEAIADLGPGDLLVEINSPGGVVWDGWAIHNLLAEHEGEVTTRASAVAASAAGVIWMAGAKREIARGGRVMVHRSRVLVMAYDPAPALRALCDEICEILEGIDEDFADLLAESSSMSREKAMEAIDRTTWYTAAQARKVGLTTTEGSERASATADPAMMDALERIGAPAELVQLYRAQESPKSAQSRMPSSLKRATPSVFADKTRPDYPTTAAHGQLPAPGS